jgi:hypothetical protein
MTGPTAQYRQSRVPETHKPTEEELVLFREVLDFIRAAIDPHQLRDREVPQP